MPILHIFGHATRRSDFSLAIMWGIFYVNIMVVEVLLIVICFGQFVRDLETIRIFEVFIFIMAGALITACGLQYVEPKCRQESSIMWSQHD